jgi:hypothetical protein
MEAMLALGASGMVAQTLNELILLFKGLAVESGMFG